MASRGNSLSLLGWQTWLLGLEASSVIGMRMMKLAAGGVAGEVESKRMVSEKLASMMELQTMAMTGALGFTPQQVAANSVRHYRKKVRSNRRRLAGES